MNKKYINGVVVGRFQPPHLGHKYMIDTALELCHNVYVLIGSAQEFNTDRNPLPHYERVKLLQTIYPDCLKQYKNIYYIPLVDIGAGNSPVWGNYIMNTVKYHIGNYPDLIVSGDEPDRDLWLDKAKYPNTEVLYLDRTKVNINATEIRAAIGKNDSWKEKVPNCIIKQCEILFSRY